MAEASTAAARRWHQALAYAITGRRHPEFGVQAAPDLRRLGEALAADGTDPLAEHVQETLKASRPWPHPVPADLMTGLGYAQFSAALMQLRSELGLIGPIGTASRGRTAQPLSSAERRLLGDVPPHHGT